MFTTTDKWQDIMDEEFMPMLGGGGLKTCGLPPTPLAYIKNNQACNTILGQKVCVPMPPSLDNDAYNAAKARWDACGASVQAANLLNFAPPAPPTPDPNAGNTPPAPPVTPPVSPAVTADASGTGKTAGKSSAGMSGTMKAGLIVGGLALVGGLILFIVKHKKGSSVASPSAS